MGPGHSLHPVHRLGTGGLDHLRRPGPCVEALVQFDTYSAELSLFRPDEIALYGRAFERLAALAVCGAEAREIMTRALERLTPRSF